MPPALTCYACEKEPTQQCPRCGRPFCDDHGEEFCGVCLEPASGVPSFNLYRGSLLALIVGAVLALWLIIQPTSGSGDSGPKLIVVTPTSSAARAATTGPAASAPAGGAAPAGTAASGTSAATVTTGTPRPPGTVGGSVTATIRPATTGTVTTGSTPPAGSGDYVVVSGDNLTLICDSKIRKPAGMTNSECVDRIKALNSLTSDAISVGQTLKVPQ